jgi:tRNA threonylcarbamoyladenosine biosynthesis protein TsaB
MLTQADAAGRPWTRVLAVDTSTERLEVALGAAGPGAPGPGCWRHQGPGGPLASTQLIPAITDLLAQAGWALDSLDAIAVGVGPGSFTGLRTACAVVQGLAHAARPGGVPVLPVPTLLAVAEEARWQREQQGGGPTTDVWAAIDARMDEIYLARYRWQAAEARWDTVVVPGLARPEALPVADAQAGQPGAVCLAGNAWPVYADRWSAGWSDLPSVVCGPTATAMLRLALALQAEGRVVAASGAQPVYVRDKVAYTTEERERIKAGGAA